MTLVLHLQLYTTTFDVVFGEVTEANLRGFGTKQVGKNHVQFDGYLML